MKRVIIFSLFIGFIGCGDLFDLEESSLAPLNPEIAIPIISSQTSFQQIIDATDDEVLFEVDSSGLLSLVYPGDTIDISAQQILLPIPVLSDILLVDTVSTIGLEFLPGLVVDRAVFKSNSLLFDLFIPDNDSYSISVNIPSFRRDNEEVSFEFSIEPQSFGRNQSPVFDLNGVEQFGPLDDIQVIYDVRNSAGERVTFDFFSINIDFVNFSYVEGAFSSQTFPIPQRFIPINTFTNLVSGSVQFQNPTLNIDIDNSFGFPIEPEINRLAIVRSSGVRADLISDLFLPGALVLDFPTIEEQVMPKTTSIVIDNSNSNIASIFNEDSQFVQLDIDAIAFPESTEASTGFISEDSELSIRTELAVPLEGSVSDFTIFENYPIDSLLELENAEELRLDLGVRNGLPVDILFQVQFVGEAFNIIDSLFSEPILIPSLEEDEFLFLTSAELSQETIERIQPTAFIRTFIGFVQSDDSETVRVLSTDEIRLEIGAVIKTTL